MSQFTIQNVPIKLSSFEIATRTNAKFTIQNVPIKFLFNDSDYTRYDYLQYIMFVFVDCNKYNTSINRLCITCILRKRFLTICEMFCFYLSQLFENSTEQK